MRRFFHLQVISALPLIGLLLCLSLVAFTCTVSAQTRASAQPSSTSPSVIVRPTRVIAHSGCIRLRLAGSGWMSGDVIDLFIQREGFTGFLGEVGTNSAGTFVFPTSTCNISPGTYTISAQGHGSAFTTLIVV